MPRGEIRLVDLDPVRGSEANKRRLGGDRQQRPSELDRGAARPRRGNRRTGHQQPRPDLPVPSTATRSRNRSSGRIRKPRPSRSAPSPSNGSVWCSGRGADVMVPPRRRTAPPPAVVATSPSRSGIPGCGDATPSAVGQGFAGLDGRGDGIPAWRGRWATLGATRSPDLATSDRAYLACLNVPDRSITTFPAVIPTSAPRRPGQMRTCGRLLRKDSPSGHPSSPNGSLMQRSGSRPAGIWRQLPCRPAHGLPRGHQRDADQPRRLPGRGHVQRM